MNSSLNKGLFLLVLVMGCIAAAAQSSPQPDGRGNDFPSRESLSADRHFRVRGSDLRVRGRVMSIAGELKEELYDLLALPQGQWEHEIHLNLYGKVGELPPPRLFRKQFKVLPNEVILQLDIHLSQGLAEDQLRTRILELLLYERGLKNLDLGEENLTAKLSPWLVEGMAETLDWKNNRSDRAAYASLFERQAIVDLDELLSEEKGSGYLEGFDLAFRVSSGALVMALLNQPEGAPALRGMLAEASLYEGEQENLIAKHFPGVNLSATSLAKWWTLQLASMSSRPAQQLYTLAETEAELAQILLIRFEGKKNRIFTVEPAHYDALKNLPVALVSMKIGRVMGRLSMLATKAFPSYRPVIQAYQGEFQKLANRKQEDPWEPGLFAQLEEERRILSAVGERMTDYLNWYTLEKSPLSTGEFEEYLQLRERILNASQSDGGPTSRYLDGVQKLYETGP